MHTSMSSRLLSCALAAALLGACPPPPGPSEDASDGIVGWDAPPFDGVADGVADEVTADTPGPGDVPTVECTSDEECEEAIGVWPACRAVACVEGTCVLGDGPDGEPCDDGDDCTAVDACFAGVCVGSGGACDDGNPCTTDGCGADGDCIHTFNALPCDDGSACTSDDHCSGGKCRGETLDCDDGEPCTIDVCSPTEGCTWTDLVGPCDDGDACTDGDACVAGECTPGAPKSCDDLNPCTVDDCDADLGCSHDVVDGACDDGDACTTDDYCQDGLCTGALVICDDGNPCTSDYCDPDAGCAFAPNQLGCDDGDPCTLSDKCAAGACVPGAPDPLCCDVEADCDDGDPCTVDTCQAGYCQSVAMSCDDGYPCTLDTCVGGVCERTPYGPLFSGPIIDDGFEAGLGAWTLTSNNVSVVWQADASKAHSGATSLYCGNIPAYSYDFGLTQAGASRMVALPPGEAALSFWIWQSLAESGTCNYDVTRVYVDGAMLEPQLCDSLETWTQQTYDLTPWGGATVQVEIRFDTVDGIANAAPGVWIDDFTVTAAAPEGCCLEDADCEGTMPLGPCQEMACEPQSYACALVFDDGACDDGDPCTADVCQGDGSCSNAPIAGCCASAGDCPLPALTCEVATCVDGDCGVDASACCASAGDCPLPALTCEVATCVDGDCGVDASACCASADDCPLPALPCEVATCVDGDCGVDASACGD